MNSREKINTDFAIFRAEHESKLYVPGQWMCPKCGFMQGKSFIGANTGNVWANLEVHDEPCPNDGTKMERLTWEQHARDAVKTAMTQLDRALSAEKERDALALTRPYDCYWSRRALAAEAKLEKAERQAEEYRLETHRWAESERKRQLSELVANGERQHEYRTVPTVPADKCENCGAEDVPMTVLGVDQGVPFNLCQHCYYNL